MDRNDIPDSALARIALDSIPTPKDDAKDIVGLVKSSGRITGYQLSDGSTVSKEDGVALAKDGEIKGVGIAHRKDTEYLKSLPDDTESNNLGTLPSVTPDKLQAALLISCGAAVCGYGPVSVSFAGQC